jgi:deoxyribodipyrimidine photolyase-related protein
MKELRLILGDQLNINHSWFTEVDSQIVYLMMEVKSEATRSPIHAQKLLGTFAAMRYFSAQLVERGHQVEYLKIDESDNQQSFSGNLEHQCQYHSAHSFFWQEPDSHYVDRELSNFLKNSGLPGGSVSSEHFYEERDSLELFMEKKKSWRMESWYRHLRVKHDVLMSDAKPLGGGWNFDKENRKSWRGEPRPDAFVRPSHDHSQLWDEIVHSGIATFGNPSADNFQWPISREESLAQLESFCETNLRYFGDYQDAMSVKHETLFHSLLSFSLNTKLISPQEVVDRVIGGLTEDFENIASIEGFTRQILGWREYIRGIYWAKMPEYLTSNEFSFTRKLPKWYWTGEVGMNCLSVTIKQSLSTGYAHHIQRLMIVGNFSLLAGLNPHDVHLWYLGIYIDALEWVEAPNTIGMSQYADGGVLATKPYVSSSAYIDRMSDYCKGCRYSRKEKNNEKSCPFDTLYWDFLSSQRKTFDKNPRMAMMLKNLDRKPDEERAAISSHAKLLREGIEQL